MDLEKKKEMFVICWCQEQHQLAEFTVQNFHEFDLFDWCLFLDCVQLSRQNIESNLKAHQAIKEGIKGVKFDSSQTVVKGAFYCGIITGLT